MCRDLDCDNANVASHAFVCNRPNFMMYENYIGFKAEIWVLHGMKQIHFVMKNLILI